MFDTMAFSILQPSLRYQRSTYSTHAPRRLLSACAVHRIFVVFQMHFESHTLKIYLMLLIKSALRMYTILQGLKRVGTAIRTVAVEHAVRNQYSETRRKPAVTSKAQSKENQQLLLHPPATR